MLALMGLVLALMWPTAAGATTGGHGVMKILGVAPGDGKLYLLYELDDGGEDLPQLSYVVLDGPKAGTIVQVHSWYREVEQDDPPEDARERFFARLERLEKRLQPAKTITPTCVAKVKVLDTRPVADPWDPAWDTEYDLRIDVAHPSAPGVHARTNRVAFGPKVEVAAEVRIPDHALAVVIVRYFAFPWEHGYHDDVALVVPLSPEAQAAGERAPAIEYKAWPTEYSSVERFGG